MNKHKSFFAIQNVSKYFAKVVANKDVSFSIERGEVLALLGENGAGKSTIMKILYGLYSADEGTIFKDGKKQIIDNPKSAQKLGIAMIQQHFSLVPAHTVTENIILGTVHGVIDYTQCESDVNTIARKYHFELPLSKLVKDLDVGTQQKVEIVKALYLNAELLIMDEPTAVLTPQEADKLMDFVTEYTRQGNSVIFITHKLKEVMKVADRIIVMRNGSICGNLQKDQTNENELSKLMVGEDIIKTNLLKRERISNEIKLSVKNINLKSANGNLLLNNISLHVYSGEIFGVAGVSGNGQEELCEVITGIKQPDDGRIELNGELINNCTIRERVNKGVGYVPVDRYRDAMVSNLSLAENMMLKTSYEKKWANHGLIDNKFLFNFTQEIIKQYGVKTPGPEAKIGSLSGGNQQKVILGREVDLGEELLVLNQPTRGLDLGAINNIHSTILHEKKAGKSILMVSTELSEIFDICDRIAVMYKGEIMGIFNNDEISVEEIGLLMAGYDLRNEVVI